MWEEDAICDSDDQPYVKANTPVVKVISPVRSSKWICKEMVTSEIERSCTEIVLWNFSFWDLRTVLRSPIIYSSSVHPMQWCISANERIGYLSVCYEAISVDLLRACTPSCAEFIVSIINAGGIKVNTQNYATSDLNLCAGSLDHFIKLSELKNNPMLLPKDSLTLFCEFSVPKYKAVKVVKMIPLLPIVANERTQDLVTNMLLEHVPCDVIFQIGDEEIQAHKKALASASPVFKAMFAHEMAENISSVVKIEDISFGAFKKVINYIYTRKIDDVAGVAAELLLAADKYDIKGLKEASVKALWKTINEENAFSVLISAYEHSCEELKLQVLQFIYQDVARSKTLEFLKFMKNDVDRRIEDELIYDLLKVFI